ncbi:Hypothetical protein POVN_LOCUS209 [uncultured virus]|nr:Hypothetical protein POVN_LOCUS209 [uncultured virus]
MTEQKVLSDVSIGKQLNAWRYRGAKVHVVMRKGSHGDDLVIGFFRRESEAKAAMTRYRTYIKEHGDPWKDQCYRKPNLEEDVYTYAIDLTWEGELGAHVYVIFSASGGVGSSMSDPHQAFADEKEARAAHKVLYKQYEADTSTFRTYYGLQMHQLGKVYHVGETHPFFRLYTEDDTKALCIDSYSFKTSLIDGKLCLHLTSIARYGWATDADAKMSNGYAATVALGLPFCGGEEYELVGARYAEVGTKCEVRYIGKEKLYEEHLDNLTRMGITVVENKVGVRTINDMRRLFARA